MRPAPARSSVPRRRWRSRRRCTAARHLTSDSVEAQVRRRPRSPPAGNAGSVRSCFLHPGPPVRRRRAGSGGPRPGSRRARRHRLVAGSGCTCGAGWPCCTVNWANPGPMSPSRRCWPGSTSGWARSWRPWPAGPPGRMTWPTRCGVCCRGRRRPGWTDWFRNGSRCPAARGCASTTRTPGRYRPSGRRRQAAGVLRLGRDAAAGGRAGAGAVPPALPGRPSAGRDGRPGVVLVRALCAGPRRDARTLPETSLAGGSVDGAGHGPDQTPDVTAVIFAALTAPGLEAHAGETLV